MRSCAITALIWGVAGCAPTAMYGNFDSANPAAKMYAIEQAARDGDRTAAARIVEQLDSDDPAVRLLAIEALHRLTGQTLGYRHYDDKATRAEAVKRWVQWLDAQADETGASPATGAGGTEQHG